jgi:glyoxylase-like metal-dependent hydrolase (beta-lactamase superfamily II)
LEKEKGWLFSGDLYIGNLLIMRNNEDMPAMIESLKKILEYDFEVLFCAHTPRLKEGKKYIKYKLEYLENFREKVLNYHKKGLSVPQIVKEIGRKEIWFYKIYTQNDIGVDFMIKSALKGVLEEK